ncbi:MAG: hypothetical protein K2L54_04805, partial [Clostridiales bacterium]|nr:hypothetical protein [Clostridiales bacterium]
MMRVEHIKPKRTSGRAYFAMIAATLVALLATVIAAVFMRTQPASAAGGAKVTIHIFDPEQNYGTIGGWIWMTGADGNEYGISANASANEQFKTTYSYNGAQETNVARTITVSVTAAQRAALNDGTAEFCMLICCATGTTTGEFWARYQKETSDVTVKLTSLFTGDEAHIYYIRRDSAAYTDIEEAKNALNRVIGVRFRDLTATSVSIDFESAIPL